jgi:hypothetical protein
VSEEIEDARAMSPYEERRWAELQRHWTKKAERRQVLPPKAQAALVRAVKGAVHLLELVTDWTTELMDPEKVLEHHRSAGREVTKLEDLKPT